MIVKFTYANGGMKGRVRNLPSAFQPYQSRKTSGYMTYFALGGKTRGDDLSVVG